MLQINNGFADYYYLTEDGKVINNKTNRELKADGRNYNLMTKDCKKKTITLKNLYKLVYNKNFCIDNICDLEQEQWREIKGTDKNYYVSDKGRVKSLCGYNAIILQEYITNKGYAKVKIKYSNGKVFNKTVSILVAQAFEEICGKPLADDWQVHHKDGNPRRNDAKNLIYLSFIDHYNEHIKPTKQE